MHELQQVQALTDSWLATFNRGDIGPFLETLHDDVEVFDNASFMPYRVESKADLILKQPSYCQFGDGLVVLNAHDASGARCVQGGFRNFGRLTATYHLGEGGWRIVNLHWSTIAEHNLQRTSDTHLARSFILERRCFGIVDRWLAIVLALRSAHKGHSCAWALKSPPGRS
jgi:hypothetical protein